MFPCEIRGLGYKTQNQFVFIPDPISCILSYPVSYPILYPILSCILSYPVIYPVIYPVSYPVIYPVSYPVYPTYFMLPELSSRKGLHPNIRKG